MNRVKRTQSSTVRRVVLVVSAVVVVAGTAVSLRLFVWPASDAARRADAVIVLAGGRGERLARADRIARAGLAPTLVISNGRARGWHAANALCADPQPFHVVCFAPRPNTTRGEAEAIGRLARARHWDRVLVVTSTYHVSRARILVRRCFHGTLVVVAAHPHDGPFAWGVRVLHEWAGMAEALVHRGC